MKLDKQNKIISILKERFFLTMDELATHLNVSRATVRRSILVMEENHLVRRFHGGISLYENIRSNHNENTNLEQEKRQIAKYTTENFITDKQTIFIGSGITTSMIKHYIDDISQLTIITNNLLLLPELLNKQHIQLILTGGLVSSPIHCMIGAPYPIEYLTKHIAVDTMLLTTDCVSNIGCSQFSTAELYFEKAFLKTVSKKILMVDHSKIGHNRPFIVASLDQFDVIVTDKQTANSLELNYKNIHYAT